MFDLEFYRMIDYFFDFHINCIEKLKKDALKKRCRVNNKEIDEALILIENKKEQLDNYISTNFTFYIAKYMVYFNIKKKWNKLF
jgi:hypothetical protein